jgi:hypothetical protein
MNKRDVLKQLQRVNREGQHLAALLRAVYADAQTPADISAEVRAGLEDLALRTARLYYCALGMNQHDFMVFQKQRVEEYFVERKGSTDPVRSFLGNPASGL